MEAAADRGDVDGADESEVEGAEGLQAAGPDPAPAGEAEAAAEAGVREPSVLDRIQDDLDDVERALQRLDEGSYGTCQTCGAAIDDELLAARPTIRFCPEHEPAPAS